MSRTIRSRKNRRRYDTTEISAINKQLGYWSLKPTRLIKVRKTQEEYARDVARAERKYIAELEKFSELNNISVDAASKLKYMSPRSGSWCYLIKRDSVRKIRYEVVQLSREEVIASAKKDFARRSRDGYWSETGRNQGFKHQAKKHVRRQNKKFTHKVMRDLDWEDQVLADHKDGKQFIWDWF